MLTKNLIKYKVSKGLIKPGFIKPNDPDLLNLANQLLSAYSLENNLSRKETDKLTTPIINSYKNIILAKGLNKLILDRCEFGIKSELDFNEFRKNIFLKSAELLNNPESDDLLEYRSKIISSLELTQKELTDNIYADLPENEKLTSIKKIYPEQLLDRYNLSLVQSLLLYSKKLTIIFEDTEPAKMRNLLKYLKFFRLVVLIHPVSKSKRKSFPNIIKVEIDGPVNLFENCHKYGLQLASFFPAVCLMTKWKLKTEINFKQNNYLLQVSNKNNLKCFYRNFGSYIPEEYSMFEKLFSKKIDDWKILKSPSFIDLGNQELIFPDFCFKNITGNIINLEFFHRWHNTQLINRLEQCEHNKTKTLMIGVDRFLYRKPEIKERLDNSEWFSTHGILFNNFPGVERVYKKLEKIAKTIPI